MKYISKLVAEKFGGLNDKTLSLNSGLNIVFGPNEAGKSTWAAVIKMMFYGWGTKKDEKIDYEKYCKDSNFLIRTFIEEYNGRQLFLERAKKDTCKVIYADDGTSVPDLTGAMPGEILFEVDRETFEKTSFVGQLQLQPGKTDGIEHKLASILKTGDAQGLVSFEDARKVLDELIKDFSGTRGNAKIKNIKSKISELESVLSENRSLLVELNEAKVLLDEKSDEFERLKLLSHSKEALNAKKTLEKLTGYIDIVKEKESKLLLKKELIQKDGISPDLEFVNMCEEKLRNCENIRQQLETIKFDYQTIKQELDDCELKCTEKSRFSEEKATTLKNEIDSLKNTIVVQEQLKIASAKSSKSLWALLFSALVLLLTGVLAVFLSAPIIMVLVVLAVAVALGIAFFALKLKRTPEPVQASQRISEILEELNCQSVQELETEINSTAVLVRECASKKSALATLGNKLQLKRNEFEGALADLKSTSKSYFVNYEDLFVLKGELNALKVQVSDIIANETEINIAKQSISALLVNNSEEQLISLAKHSVEEFDAAAAEGAAIQASAVDLEIRTLGEEIARKSAMLGTKGKTLDEIEVESSHQYELLREYTEKDQAARLAMELLGEAYEEFSSKYAPELAVKAQEIFSRITGDKYDVTKMNSEFELTVGDSRIESRFDESKLSTGTLEQLWISLRLALVEMIYEKSGMKPPLVLDDAFVNFDDERCKKALEYLVEISKERQIILFTCHTREAEYLRKNGEVNIILSDSIWAI